MPAPAAITSAPPAASIVSAPEPVVIVFAEAVPVTVRAVDSALASRLSKLVTLTVSPLVWSLPAATEKFTAVVPPDTASTSMSVAVPPSIEVSDPR